MTKHEKIVIALNRLGCVKMDSANDWYDKYKYKKWIYWLSIDSFLYSGEILEESTLLPEKLVDRIITSTGVQL